MSASEVAPNPFWYAKSTAALTSRDRLSICILVMSVHQSVNQLSMTGIGQTCQASIRVEAFGDLHEFGKLGKLVTAKEAAVLV